MSISVYVCVCVCVCVCTQLLKNNGSICLKLEHVVEYENSSEKFDIGHFPIKVKVIALHEFFLHLPQYKLSNPISYFLVHVRKL